MRTITLTLILIAHATLLAAGVAKPPTPTLVFVNEYARELISSEEVRARADAELSETKDETGKLVSFIHAGTLIQLELRSQINMLNEMHLSGQFDKLIPDISAFYANEITLFQRTIDIVTEILSAPKPGIDYGKLTAEMPKVRAEIEDIDHTLFADVTPLVCMLLIDPKPDSKNHVSHIVITKAEKAALMDRLVNGFGDTFNQKSKNFMVSAGLVMKEFLESHECSDDPWE